jgi:hypothetical protein
MGYVPATPPWVYDALVRDPKPHPPHWSVRFAPLVVMVVVALAGTVIYLIWKGAPL